MNTNFTYKKYHMQKHLNTLNNLKYVGELTTLIEMKEYLYYLLTNSKCDNFQYFGILN